MDKYIKRDYLITFLDWDDGEGIWTLSDEELKHLEDKAIDAVPVVHGHWTKECLTDTDRQCSVCGGFVFGWHHLAECTYKYCPWCGAKMDGEENAAD